MIPLDHGRYRGSGSCVDGKAEVGGKRRMVMVVGAAALKLSSCQFSFCRRNLIWRYRLERLLAEDGRYGQRVEAFYEASVRGVCVYCQRLFFA